MGIVFGHARELAVGDVHRLAVEDGNAVIGFLSNDGRLVTEIGEGEGRKLMLLAFDFLQEQKIRLFGFEEGGNVGFAGADRVDVPGGDFGH